MSLTRAWLYVLIAGLLEVVWAVALKRAAGFTRLGPSVLTVSAMGGSFWFLSQALKVLPVGSAYAAWTGIGAVGTALFGIVLLGEPRTAMRLVCIGLIVLGIVGLKVTSSA